MNRRHFLKVGGSAAFGLAFGGCAPAFVGRPDSRRPMVTLPPVEVSWERIIRTTVGLRPHRASGFVVRPEQLDDRTVVHNYGHGGAGMSVSWGTAHLAADIAVEHLDRRAAVIGCGIVGLTTARILQRRGFDVTIYAASLPPDTTSNMSWAGFTPGSGLVTQRTPEFDGQFQRAIEIAYREHQLLVGRGYGVSWIYSYSPTDDPGRAGGGPFSGGEGTGGANPLVPDAVEAGSALLRPGELPFTTRYARRTPSLVFDPTIYLEALMRDVLLFGGRIVVQEFDTSRDLLSLEERLIVNCTGLGAKRLFDDDELTPVKGQLVVLVPQPEVDYSIGGMLPRRDGIVLGHMQQRGDWSLDVDEAAQQRIMESAMRTFGTLRPMRVAAAPSAGSFSPPPVESFLGLQS